MFRFRFEERRFEVYLSNDYRSSVKHNGCMMCISLGVDTDINDHGRRGDERIHRRSFSHRICRQAHFAINLGLNKVLRWRP